MKIEQLNKWKPSSNVFEKYILQDFSDAPKGFSLVLSAVNNNQKIHITFGGIILAYRLTAPLLSKIYKEHTKQAWAFFKISNSIWAKKLSLSSCETYAAEDFTHFAIVTANYVIEIMDWRSAGDPDIKEVESS